MDTYGAEALPDRPPLVDMEIFRFQTLVCLMLSSQTKDPMVASAMVRLKQGMSDRGGLSMEGVQSSTEDEVRTFIYGVGFHNNKAKYEKNIIIFL